MLTRDRLPPENFLTFLPRILNFNFSKNTVIYVTGTLVYRIHLNLEITVPPGARHVVEEWGGLHRSGLL